MIQTLKLIALSFAVFILISNKGGRNEACTGAPFENNKFACGDCHSGGSFTPEVEISLKDKNNLAVSQYVAGDEYTIEMKISSLTGKPAYYGFQAVVTDQRQKQAGEFLALGDKVRKLTFSERVYIMQISPKPDGLYTAKWKATAEDTATVYIAGLAANGNNGTGGDKTKVASFLFTKTSATSTSDLNILKVQLLKYTLVNDVLHFTKEVRNVSVFDLNGNKVKQDFSDYGVYNLLPGLYVVQYNYNGQMYAEKFMKL